MKTALCLLVLAVVAVYGAEEKKNEKRGLLGLGYGVASAPIVSHGYYGHGLAASAPLLGHGYYGGHGLGLYGHGVAAAPVLSHGYYGHGLASAPLISHGVSYGAPLAYDSHYLGSGHGYGWH